jgi:hypothetical protein
MPVENRNQYLLLIAAFAAGVVVGAKWPVIRKKLEPWVNVAGDQLKDVYNTVARFVAEQGEAVSDRMAEAKARKRSAKAQSMAGGDFMSTVEKMFAPKAKARPAKAAKPRAKVQAKPKAQAVKAKPAKAAAAARA